MGKKLFIVVGRFAPLTKAHVDMIVAAMKEASSHDAAFKIVLTFGKIKDERSPFPPDIRLELIRRYFDESVIIHATGNIYDSFDYFSDDFDDVRIVCGEDRWDVYNSLCDRLNRKEGRHIFSTWMYEHPQGRESISGTIARKFLKERNPAGFVNIMHDSIPFLSRLYIYEALLPFIDEANNGNPKDSA